MTAGFSRPVQLAAGEGIEGFHCGVEIVDEWAARHAATARARGTDVYKRQVQGCLMVRLALI